MKKKFFAEHRRFWLGLGSVLFVLAAWEVLLTYVFPLNPFFFTKPSLIAVAFKEQVIYGALWDDGRLRGVLGLRAATSAAPD